MKNQQTLDAEQAHENIVHFRICPFVALEIVFTNSCFIAQTLMSFKEKTVKSKYSLNHQHTVGLTTMVRHYPVVS